LKAQWTNAFRTEIVTYFPDITLTLPIIAPTDQLLTEANEVLETGTKLNAHYKANSNLTLLLGYQVNETGMLNQTTVSAPSYSSTKKDVLPIMPYLRKEYNKGNSYLRLECA
jgi:hypothetical protein